MVHQHGDEHVNTESTGKASLIRINSSLPTNHPPRAGAWLPADHRIHKKWVGQQIDHVEKHPQQLVPELQEFKQLIEGNARIYMLANSMFEEIPVKKPYNKDPTGYKQFRDYHQMLQVLNHILSTSLENC
jgi:phosphatidylserine decarboxylase